MLLRHVVKKTKKNKKQKTCYTRKAKILLFYWYSHFSRIFLSSTGVNYQRPFLRHKLCDPGTLHVTEPVLWHQIPFVIAFYSKCPCHLVCPYYHKNTVIRQRQLTSCRLRLIYSHLSLHSGMYYMFSLIQCRSSLQYSCNYIKICIHLARLTCVS